MDQTWFEMNDLRKRGFANASWIPLRSSHDKSIGDYGIPGHLSEFTGIGSVLIPINKREEGGGIVWSNMGLNQYGPYAFETSYKTAETFQLNEEHDLGVFPVIVQNFDGIEPNVWHLNQDLIVALGLMREDDIWTCPRDGYVDVIRLSRNQNGSESLLEIRSQYLKDYLAARKMAMRLVCYFSRRATVQDAQIVNWSETGIEDIQADSRYKGSVRPLHRGGMPYGAEMMVMKVWHSADDLDPDVPVLPGPDRSNHESKTMGQKGEKVYDIEGQFWRNEWIEPGPSSPKIKGDEVPSNCFFIIDPTGKKENADTLNDEDIGRWLWFRPEVARAILAKRGSSLSWYTAETGNIEILSGYQVHFGVNEIGLITVYARDIGCLPEWQRVIWVAFNVTPEGGNSRELAMAQVQAEPADTIAAEEAFEKGLDRLNAVSAEYWGRPVFKEHKDTATIIKAIHRFRSFDEASLLALAKDIARLTADSIDADLLREITPPPPNKNKPGSLKLLEKAVELVSDAATARKMMGPLFGVYDLRLGDAHLASSQIDAAKTLVGIIPGDSFLEQGEAMIAFAAIAINEIAETLEQNG